jgi:ribosomal protein S17
MFACHASRCKSFAAWGLAPLVCAAVLLPAPQTVAVTQVTETKPIKLKQPKLKKEKYKGTVVSATMLAITVRHERDLRMIQTFRLAPQASEKMVKVLERGGYQSGDKVTVVHERGSDVALEVKGKPSAAK